MNLVEEVLLELELVQVSLAQVHLKVDTINPLMTLLRQLVDIMVMTLKDTISKDCLEKVEMMSSGDTTLTKDY